MNLVIFEIKNLNLKMTFEMDEASRARIDDLLFAVTQ
jgi:hypothetical protein